MAFTSEIHFSPGLYNESGARYRDLNRTGTWDDLSKNLDVININVRS